MDIHVKNCSNCPFLIVDIDYDAVGSDTIERCNLAHFFRLEENIIDVYNSYERDLHCDYCNNWDSIDDDYDKSKCTCKELYDNIEEVNNTPKWCPLRTNNVINIIQDR